MLESIGSHESRLLFKLIYVYFLALRNHTTGLTNITYMSTVGSDRVALCTRENSDWKMLQYSTAHGGKLKNAMLHEAPSGITDIMLGDKLCVVVSYT